MAEWSKVLLQTVCCLSPLRACPDGRVVVGVATDCSLSHTSEGLPLWQSGRRCCHRLLTVSHLCGPALMVEWSKVLLLIACCLTPLRACPDGWVVKVLPQTVCCLSPLRACPDGWVVKVLPQTVCCLSPLRACPDGRVVVGVATDCLLSLTTEGLPEGWVVKGVATDCLSPLKAFPDGWVVVGVATDYSLSLTSAGLPWWQSGRRCCHRLLTVSHLCGPALMVEWSKVLLLIACCLTPLRACPDGWVVKVLPQTVCCLSPLRACPGGWVVVGVATDCSLSLTSEGLPWWQSGLRCCYRLFAVSHLWGPALMAEWL